MQIFLEKLFFSKIFFQEESNELSLKEYEIEEKPENETEVSFFNHDETVIPAQTEETSGENSTNGPQTPNDGEDQEEILAG